MATATRPGRSGTPLPLVLFWVVFRGPNRNYVPIRVHDLLREWRAFEMNPTCLATVLLTPGSIEQIHTVSAAKRGQHP